MHVSTEIRLWRDHGFNMQIEPGDGRVRLRSWTNEDELEAGTPWTVRSVDGLDGTVGLHCGRRPRENAGRALHKLLVYWHRRGRTDAVAGGPPRQRAEPSLVPAGHAPPSRATWNPKLDPTPARIHEFPIVLINGTSPSALCITLGAFRMVFTDVIAGPAWQDLALQRECLAQVATANVLVASLAGLGAAWHGGALSHCRPELFVIASPPLDRGARDAAIRCERQAKGKWLFENDEWLHFRHVLSTPQDGLIRLLVDADGSWTAETHWHQGGVRALPPAA